MRVYLLLIAFVICLGSSQAASAQYKSDAAVEAMMAQSKIYEDGFSIDKLFDSRYFRMHHSYQVSFGSFGGATAGLGEYTNTMLWRFSPNLAARVDVGVAHSLFGDTGRAAGIPGAQNSFSNIYLKNAEVAYQPVKNMTLHLAFRQAPRGYGYYLSPYGYYGYRGYGGYGAYGGYGGYSSASALVGYGGADRFDDPRAW